MTVQQHQGQAPRALPFARWVDLALTGLVLASAGTLVLAAVLAVFAPDSDQIGWDFRIAYLPAADAVADGRSPYPDPSDPNLDLPRSYVYPPQLAFALVPFTWLPPDLAAFLGFVLSVLAFIGVLALVGVRDIRCYAAVLLWAPTWNSLDTLNISSALALGVALVWRFRSTVWPLAATLGLLVSLKLFLWPLVGWVALTRRLVPALLAVAIGLVVTAAAWGAIGFAGLDDYLTLLRDVGEQESYSITGMGVELGLPRALASGIALVAGGVLLALAVQHQRRRDEVTAFALAVTATLALSPVVWLHYLTLLIAPLGLVRPRFSWPWLLPIVLWVSPRDENGEGLHPYVPAVVAVVLVAFLVVASRRQPEPEGAM